MIEPIEDLKNNVRFFTTISIFLITIINYYFRINNNEQSLKVTFDYSAFVIIPLLIYVLIYYNLKKLEQNKELLGFLNRQIIFLIISIILWALFLFNIEPISKILVILLRWFSPDIIIPTFKTMVWAITIFLFYLAPIPTLLLVTFPGLWGKFKFNLLQKIMRLLWFQRKISVPIIMIVLLIPIILFCVIYINNLNDYIPFNPYTYEVGGSELNAIRDLRINHNFSEKSGSINFKINKEDYFGISPQLYFNLPLQIDNKTLKVYYGDNNSNLNELKLWKTNDEIAGEINYTQLIFDSLPQSDSEETFYNIEYIMDIKPHGRYIFNHPNINLYGFNPLISFNLGEKYLCYGSCIELIRDIKPGYPNTDKEIKLNLERNTTYNIFEIKATSDVRIQQGLSLSILVSSLFTMLTLIEGLIKNY